MVQEVDHIILRAWSMADLDDLVQFANNPAIADNLTDAFPHPYTYEEGVKFINMVSSDLPPKVHAIDLHGRAIGGIGVFPQSDIFRMNAEIGYWLAEPFWGKGFITKAIALKLNDVFTHWPVDRVFARPFGRNLASQRVLEKVGFQLEARFNGVLIKKGLREDELVYGMRKSDWLENSMSSQWTK